MHLLQSGVDITLIALWLGHEDTATTHQYFEAELEMKEAALKRLIWPDSLSRGESDFRGSLTRRALTPILLLSLRLYRGDRTHGRGTRRVGQP
jgi:hypothetical protein